MAELAQPKFEHSALERDIERLSKEIQELKTKLPAVSERELVKTAIGTRIPPQPTPSPQPQPSPILPAYLQQESPEIKLKVEKLVDLAFHKGIDTSIAEARKYGAFILDALHDTLTSKIYDELKARKLL